MVWDASGFCYVRSMMMIDSTWTLSLSVPSLGS